MAIRRLVSGYSGTAVILGLALPCVAMCTNHSDIPPSFEGSGGYSSGGRATTTGGGGGDGGTPSSASGGAPPAVVACLGGWAGEGGAAGASAMSSSKEGSFEEDLSSYLPDDTKPEALLVGPSNDLYVAGSSFISRYTRDGTRLWIRDMAEDEDVAKVTVLGSDASGGLFFAGKGFLGSFDDEGETSWIRPLPSDVAPRVFNQSGQLYALSDSRLHQYNSLGKSVWNVPLFVGLQNLDRRTASPEWVMALDASGNILLAGSVWLKGLDQKVGVLRKFTPLGELLWTSEENSDLGERIRAITTDAEGKIYVASQIGPDPILTVFDSTGAVLRTDPISPASGVHRWSGGRVDVRTLAIDPQYGNLVVGGSAEMTLDDDDEAAALFFRMYDPEGREVWSHVRTDDERYFFANFLVAISSCEFYWAGYFWDEHATSFLFGRVLP